MKNEAWFYKDVRYAKDGRYCCYAPTPQTKREVLLKGATCTLAIDTTLNSKARDQITPFNIREKELLIRFPYDNSQLCEAFMSSNYFIFHSLDTGMYYFYYIDYIEPYQQMSRTTENALISIPNNIVFRVGISIDYWQTYFFRMCTYFSSPISKPTPCAPHENTSDVVNWVKMPTIDFANVSRTNMHSILQDCGSPERNTSFRPLVIPRTYNANQRTRSINLIEKTQTTNPNGFFILCKFQLSWLEAGEASSQEVRGTVWGYSTMGTGASTSLLSVAMGSVRRTISNLLVSTGMIGADYTFPSALFGASGGTIHRGQTYTLEEAYLIPQAWGAALFSNIITEQDGFIVIPTNYARSGITIRPVNVSQLTASGTRVLQGTSVTPINTMANSKNYTYKEIIDSILSVYPTAPLPLDAYLPLLKIGTPNFKIPLTPTINTVTVLADGKLLPAYTNYDPDGIAISITLEISPYSIKITLSNGTQIIDIQKDYALPIRGVTDNAEIERQKSNYELSQIAQAISLGGSIAGGVGSALTGNIFGGVMSASNIASQSIQLVNSITNPPDFAKMRQSNTLNPTPNTFSLVVPLGIEVPEELTTTNNQNIYLITSYRDEFTEIGIEVGGALYRNNDIELNNAQYQGTGFIEMGAVLCNIAQEAGEVLERRFREGVNFWYE